MESDQIAASRHVLCHLHEHGRDLGGLRLGRAGAGATLAILGMLPASVDDAVLLQQTRVPYPQLGRRVGQLIRERPGLDHCTEQIARDVEVAVRMPSERIR